MPDKLDKTANVAIIIAASVFVVLVVEQRFGARQSGSVRDAQPVVGDVLSIPGVDWNTSTTTVVLALSTECHFCRESADFYRRLAAAVRPERTRIIGVFPQDIKAARTFLSDLQIVGVDVRQVDLRQVHVRATPTVFLIDNLGRVRRVWTGRLRAPQEQEVVSSVRLGGG